MANIKAGINPQRDYRILQTGLTPDLASPYAPVPVVTPEPCREIMKLSIVTTLYCSSRYIHEFYERISTQARLVTDRYEIIFVNDGSPDNSLEVAKKIGASDACVKVIDLSRNFGHHRAMMCGLGYTSGTRVFLIDVDLEEQPEALGEFWREMDADPELDIVIGELEEKPAPFFKKGSSEAFYKAFNALSSVKISSRDMVSRLMTRGYVDALLQYHEKEIFFPAIWEDVGFKQKRLRATKSFDGFTTYTLRKKLVMAFNAITSFSSKPLIYISYLGLLFSMSSLAFMALLVIRRLSGQDVMLGWTSMIAVVFLIGGIIMFALGLVGIYISKIYDQVKGRPNVIVKRVYSANNGQ